MIFWESCVGFFSFESWFRSRSSTTTLITIISNGPEIFLQPLENSRFYPLLIWCLISVPDPAVRLISLWNMEFFELMILISSFSYPTRLVGRTYYFKVYSMAVLVYCHQWSRILIWMLGKRTSSSSISFIILSIHRHCIVCCASLRVLGF